MSLARPRGIMLRCRVCGAEIAVLSRNIGDFCPRCCNTTMVPIERRLAFFRCHVCGAEIAVVCRSDGVFSPRCCCQPMRLDKNVA